MTILALASALALHQTPHPAEQIDPYVWLEDVNGKRSLDWVRAENAQTAETLEGDVAQGSLVAVKTCKPLFDASNLKVEQLFATSTDGTKVPYFVVHRAGLVYDGNTPTLLEAYGGFDVSETPFYSGTLGKLC